MNKEEFITKFYSCDDEEQFLKDVYHNLNCLRQENKQLKENYERIYNVTDISLLDENYKLKDNWNKLKKYINEANEDLYWTNNYDDILYVMQKLEGSDSNE